MNDLISRKTALASIKLNAMLRVQDIYDSIENQPGTRLEITDWDHIWLNGRQYVSLKRAGEMVAEARESTEVNVFDQEEIHEHCTVQVLRNSLTGEESVGWWREDQ